MNYWWIFALISGVGLAGRNILMKVANFKLDPALASMVLAASMAVTSIGFLVAQRMGRQGALIPAGTNMGAVAVAALAGIALAGANIFLSFAYKSGGSAGLIGIMQNGISLSLTILLSVLFLSEVIKPVQVLGAVFAVIGILMIVK
jgi:uncharacterized membrane protein